MYNYVIFMILSALCLSTIGVLTKLSSEFLTSYAIAFLRFFVGFLTILPIVFLIDRSWYKVSKQDLKQFASIGFVFSMTMVFYISGMVLASVQNVVLLQYSYPIFILLIGYFFLGDKITKTEILVLLLALIGLFIINPFNFNNSSDIGNVLSLISAIFTAILILLMKQSDIHHSIGSFVWHLFFASIFTLPFVLIFGFGDIFPVIEYILLIGFISTGLAYLFYNLALEKLPAEICSLIALVLTPLIGIILAVLIIDEELTLNVLIGGLFLLIAGGVMKLSSFLSSKKIKSLI